jgi:HK97 family phage major capsid protein
MSKKLKDEMLATRDEALNLVKKAQEEGRDITAEEKTANEKRYSRCMTIKGQLEEEQKFAELSVPDVKEVLKMVKGNTGDKAKEEYSKGLSVDHYTAVNRYISTGIVPSQYTIIAGPPTTGTVSAGNGITLPAAKPIFIKRNINAFKAVLQAYDVKVITAPYWINTPLIDDTANVADVVAQDSTGDNVKEPLINNTVLGNNLYDSGTSWFSNGLLDNVDYDFLAEFQPALDKRLELKQLTAWTAYTTTGGTAATNVITSTSPTGVTYADLVKARFAMPTAYSQDMAWIVSRQFFAAVYGLVDAQGRPLYLQSLSDEAPDRLLNIPVFLTDTLSDTVANGISAMLVSASALRVREAGPRKIIRYVNYPQRLEQAGIREAQYGGFGFVQNGVVLFKQHA